MTPFPFTLIDLTHLLLATVPCWGGGCGFSHHIVHDYNQSEGITKFRVGAVEMQAGIGTHIDAPAHCIPGGATIEHVPLEQLCVPAVVIDVSERANSAFLLQPADIERFETIHGVISSGALVIIHTGWSKKWSDAEAYRNNLQFPSISEDAARLLLQRKVVGIGIDTLSPDLPASGFPVHRILLSAGCYIVENVANANRLPATGAYVLTLPMAIADGTEAPIRMVGMIPQALPKD